MSTSRLIVTIIVSAFILFIWNSISWMILPFHSNLLLNIPEQAIDVEALKNNMPSDGVYHFPGLPVDDSPLSWKEIENQVKTGPRITMMVYKSGPTELFSGRIFFLFFCCNLASALIVFLVIRNIKRKTRMRIIVSSLAIGLVICTGSIFPNTLWYLYPSNYVLVEISDVVISFLLVGIFLSLYTFKNSIVNEGKAEHNAALSE